MRKLPESLRVEVLRLRVQERASLSTIVQTLGISRGAASALLRDYPLEKPEVERRHHDGVAAYGERVQAFGKSVQSSKFAGMLNGETLSPARKGQIAEAAVAFRLAVLGYDVLRSVFEGSKVDWLAVKSGHAVRVQVKWARINKHGRPIADLRDHKARQNVSAQHCDFLAAYNLDTDCAYVVSAKQCEGKSSFTCSIASGFAHFLAFAQK